MSRSKRYTQNGAERIAITLRSASCLCATDGGRLLHPPSADENECGELAPSRACVRSINPYVFGNTLVCVIQTVV